MCVSTNSPEGWLLHAYSHIYTCIKIAYTYLLYNISAHWYNHTSQIGDNDDVANSSKFTRAPGVRRDFIFTKTFDENANQEEIFETVARKIVDRFMDGYNGTVFAYGQTSTGKTYTVEGSARQYEERGLIPR